MKRLMMIGLLAVGAVAFGQERDAAHVLNTAKESPEKLVDYLRENLPDADWAALEAACTPGDSEMLRRAQRLAEFAERAGFDASTVQHAKAELERYRKRVPLAAGGTLMGYTAEGKAVYGGADAEDSEAADTWVYVPADVPVLKFAGTRGDTPPPSAEEQRAALATIEAAEGVAAPLKERYIKAKAVAASRAAGKTPSGGEVTAEPVEGVQQ